MANTYGQLKENKDKPILYSNFEKEVAERLKQYVLIKPTIKHLKMCKSLYKKGYTISDTVGMIILNS